MVWLPLAVNLLVAPGLPAVARRLPYRVRPVALTTIALVTAACWVCCLTLLAASFVDRLPAVARRIGAPPAPRALAQIPPPVAGAAATILVAAAVGMLLASAARTGRDLVRAERFVRAPRSGPVLILPDPAPDACAVGGITGGRIVVTAGLLACLDPAERHAVLGHERAHLTGGHHWLRMTVRCCAAANPLLTRLPALLDTACERWADEHAAPTAEQRRTLARALGKVALASLRASREPSPPPATDGGFHRSAVTERMTALLADPPRPTRLDTALGLLGTGIATIMIGATIHAGTDYLSIFH